jgi:hypothetical protein
MATGAGLPPKECLHLGRHVHRPEGKTTQPELLKADDRVVRVQIALGFWHLQHVRSRASVLTGAKWPCPHCRRCSPRHQKTVAASAGEIERLRRPLHRSRMAWPSRMALIRGRDNESKVLILAGSRGPHDWRAALGPAQARHRYGRLRANWNPSRRERPSLLWFLPRPMPMVALSGRGRHDRER